MRYCVVSITAVSGHLECARAKSVSAKPFLLASSDKTVGGSCRWSPANTVFFPLNIAPQHAGSSACAASSMTTTSKVSFRKELVNAPDNVQHTTRACDTTTVTAFFCRALVSF